MWNRLVELVLGPAARGAKIVLDPEAYLVLTPRCCQMMARPILLDELVILHMHCQILVPADR